MRDAIIGILIGVVISIGGYYSYQDFKAEKIRERHVIATLESIEANQLTIATYLLSMGEQLLGHPGYVPEFESEVIPSF